MQNYKFKFRKREIFWYRRVKRVEPSTYHGWMRPMAKHMLDMASWSTLWLETCDDVSLKGLNASYYRKTRYFKRELESSNTLDPNKCWYQDCKFLLGPIRDQRNRKLPQKTDRTRAGGRTEKEKFNFLSPDRPSRTPWPISPLSPPSLLVILSASLNPFSHYHIHRVPSSVLTNGVTLHNVYNLSRVKIRFNRGRFPKKHMITCFCGSFLEQFFRN